MKIVDLSAFHIVSNLGTNQDHLIVPHTQLGAINTVQSLLLKAPKSHSSEFVVKTEMKQGTRTEILNVIVDADSTRIINVKQQLPAGVGMFAYASAGGTVTANGITATLGE